VGSPALAVETPPPVEEPAAELLAELDGHHPCEVCTPYKLGSGAGTRKCGLAASLRILLVRVASKHGLDVIPTRIRLWVVGPNQRRWTKAGWKYTEGPNGTYWRPIDQKAGDVHG
jgi:hypothetical protein